VTALTREQLEHVIRAAAVISDDDELVVVGSQAILGQFPDAPEPLRVSVEVDLYPRRHPERADLIDGSIGELSPFHETYGYYAQGVGPGTSVLPEGWEERLVPVRGPATRGATGWCLEVHDLVLSKYVPFREKDEHFIRQAIHHGLVEQETLLARLPRMPIDPERAHLIGARIERHFREAFGAG
jgi:hypothetical protein